MADFAAFLRGVNLGRHRRVSNAELKACLESLGLNGVSAFRASGNLAFSAGDEPQAELGERIEQRLEASLGYPVEVFLRTAREVRAMAAEQPFEREVLETSRGKLQVAILAAEPAVEQRRAVLELASDLDRLAFGERELYWLPSGGTLESPLDMALVARLLGSSTMRTKGTIEQLAAKHFAP